MKKNIILGLLLVYILFTATACNNNNNKNNDKPIENNPTETQQTNSETSNDLFSDDTKLVYQTGNTKYVFYYNGESITGQRTYAEYDSEETAQAAYEFLKTQETNNKIYTIDNYLVVEFGPDEYANLTTNDIKSAYSYMTEVTR